MERVRCSSLVDWPVYPRLAHTMQASTGVRNADPDAMSHCGESPTSRLATQSLCADGRMRFCQHPHTRQER